MEKPENMIDWLRELAGAPELTEMLSAPVNEYEQIEALATEEPLLSVKGELKSLKTDLAPIRDNLGRYQELLVELSKKMGFEVPTTESEDA